MWQGMNKWQNFPANTGESWLCFQLKAQLNLWMEQVLEDTSAQQTHAELPRSFCEVEAGKNQIPQVGFLLMHM